jgi:hypothetical protein
MTGKDLVIRLAEGTGADESVCEITGTVELEEGTKVTKDTLVRIKTVRDDEGVIAGEHMPGGKISKTATLGYLQEILINKVYSGLGQTGYEASFSIKTRG